MERPGRVDGHSIRLKKTIELAAGAAGPVGPLRTRRPARRAFASTSRVEINLAAMAGHAPDRFYSDPAGTKLGMLDERLDLPHARGLSVTDQWLDLADRPDLVASGRALWCFPDRDRQPERGGNRRGLSIFGGHPPLARDGRRHVAAGTSRFDWSLDQIASTAKRTPGKPLALVERLLEHNRFVRERAGPRLNNLHHFFATSSLFPCDSLIASEAHEAALVIASDLPSPRGCTRCHNWSRGDVRRWFHADRTAGRHRDHRGFDRTACFPPCSRRAKRPGGSSARTT